MIDKKNLPAFPSKFTYGDTDFTGAPVIAQRVSFGLTKREYFAGKIINGICSAIYDKDGQKLINDINLINETIRLTDELLKQLEK